MPPRGRQEALGAVPTPGDPCPGGGRGWARAPSPPGCHRPWVSGGYVKPPLALSLARHAPMGGTARGPLPSASGALHPPGLGGWMVAWLGAQGVTPGAPLPGCAPSAAQGCAGVLLRRDAGLRRGWHRPRPGGTRGSARSRCRWPVAPGLPEPRSRCERAPWGRCRAQPGSALWGCPYPAPSPHAGPRCPTAPVRPVPIYSRCPPPRGRYI